MFILSHLDNFSLFFTLMDFPQFVKWYVTVNFVKEKSDAVDEVINYLTHLIMQGCTPKAIQTDGGGEFVNDKLKSWCASHGIILHITALYSPSQNGVAECMNCTLVELGRAMLIAHDLPEFLSEYAVAEGSRHLQLQTNKHDNFWWPNFGSRHKHLEPSKIIKTCRIQPNNDNSTSRFLYFEKFGLGTSKIWPPPEKNR